MKRYQVFVSSTFTDLRSERQRLWETLTSFNYIVVGMENFPATNESQLDYIQKQIDQSDYYIVVCAGRYGSEDPDGISYTEREYDYAESTGVPIVVFIHNDVNAIPSGSVDTDPIKLDKLSKFKNKISSRRIVNYWNNADGLCLDVAKSLQRLIDTNKRPGWVRGSADSDANSSGQQAVKKIRGDSDVSTRISSDAANLALRAFLIEKVPVKYNIKDRKSTERQIEYFRIVEQFRLLETPDEDTVSESMRGAISSVENVDFSEVTDFEFDVEDVIIHLAANKIVEIAMLSGAPSVRNGIHWVAAIQMAKDMVKRQIG